MKHRARSLVARAARIESLERRMLLSLAPVGSEFHANTVTAGTLNTAIAADADGDFVIAWGRSADSDIYVRRFDPRGRGSGS